MSINACSINAQTINALCRRRQVVPPVVEQPLGHGSTALGQDIRNLIPPRYEIEDREPVNFELPDVTVAVLLDGKVYTQTLNVSDAQLSFVAISNLKLSDELSDVSVNISDLRL